MPREYVPGLPMPEREELWHVAVGWSRHGQVQIATTDPNAEEPYSAAAGLWIDLDRSRINDLIRLLRKARDGAFGKDE